ncbi:MAG: LCP family protein [Treponema sp.]|jgi:anionic cell wall polymer biosynthesis LytR-Cps2A-Psr (LCP) family protein|nr:LCP family protein [Treponema sp.]
MKKTRIDASAFLLASIGFLLAGGIVFIILTLRSDPIEEALSGDRVINTLVVVEHERKPFCTYALMYYPATKRAAIFDIPGSVARILRGIDQVDRIDRVYDPQRVSLFENEVEGLLGVDITFTFVMDMDNLGNLTDLIEGVEVFIPSVVEVFGEDEIILFPSGITRLDGDKARLYVTYELPEENPELPRFRRQRFFLGLLKRLGEQSGNLKDPQVSPYLQSFLRTGVSRRTLLKVLDEHAGIDIDRVPIQTVGGNVREVSGQSLILPYYDGNSIKEMVRHALGTLVRPVEGSQWERVFTVEVLNGTVINGLAGRTAELLRGFGFDVISIGNADSQDYEKTLILDRSGQEDAVKALGEIISCNNIRSETEGQEPLPLDFNLQNFEYHSDFTLIIGRDFNGRYVTGE